MKNFLPLRSKQKNKIPAFMNIFRAHYFLFISKAGILINAQLPNHEKSLFPYTSQLRATLA